jgi:hypothetical protein
LLRNSVTSPYIIEVHEVMNQVVASTTDHSLVIAARTDPAFAREGPNGNTWKPLTPSGTASPDAKPHPYPDGIGDTKISRLAVRLGALLVDMQAAFVEPQSWFQGAPILRSKFSVVAQDQVRRLRCELARKQEK